MPPRTDYLKSSRKFDVPLYCASWVPVPKDVHIDKEDDKAATSTPVSGPLVVFGGGGGASKHGIKNHIIMASYSFADRELSEELYHRSTDEEPPFKLAVHPGGTDLIAAFDGGCKLFEVSVGSQEKLIPSDRKIDAFEKAAEQKFVVFSPDGTRVALGGEDRRLQVFDWPSMEVVLDVERAHKAPLKDADFSVDGSFLATSADSGPCHVWDLSKDTPIATLDMPKGAKIGLCRFSRDASKPFLFMSVVRGGDGWVAVWNTINWQKLGLKKVHGEAISAMAVSPNGNYLATGTSGGDVFFVEIQKMVVKKKVKGAHMVFVTALQFSPDSSALLSVSGDSSARVTPVPTTGTQLKIWQIYLLLAALFLLSILVAYIWYLNSDWFYQFPMGRAQVGHFSHEALGRRTWPPPTPEGGVGKIEL